jgi:hypothetical protein
LVSAADAGRLALEAKTDLELPFVGERSGIGRL